MFDKASDTFFISGLWQAPYIFLCQLLEFRFSRQNGHSVVMNKKQGKVSHFEYYFLSSWRAMSALPWLGKVEL